MNRDELHRQAIEEFCDMAEGDRDSTNAARQEYFRVDGIYGYILGEPSQVADYLIELGFVIKDGTRVLYTQLGIDFYEKLGRI